MSRIVCAGALVVVLLGGCSPRFRGIRRTGRELRVQSLQLTPGHVVEYEGELRQDSTFAGGGTDTRYALTLINFVLERSDRGYQVASLRRLRDLRALSGPPGTVAPPHEEYHLLTVDLRPDLTRAYPRPAVTVTPPLLSLIDEWHFPALAVASLAPGVEWQWQERMALPALRLDDCRVRYRVMRPSQRAGHRVFEVEETATDPLPLKPNSPLPGAPMEDALIAFSQQFWLRGASPVLVKFAKRARTEKVVDASTATPGGTVTTKLHTRLEEEFELKREQTLTGSARTFASEQVRRFEELQQLTALGAPDRKTLEAAMERARDLAADAGDSFYGVLAPAVRALLTALEQKASSMPREAAPASEPQSDRR